MTAASDPTLARVVSELEIRNVLARLAQLADSGDIDDYLRLFTDDAVWDMPDNPRGGMGPSIRRGRAAIAEGAYERREANEKGPELSRMHVVSTTSVDVADDDMTATAISYFQFIVSNATESKVAVLGTYSDTMRKVEGAWKLARHVIVFG